MEITSGIISEEQIRTEIDALKDFLLEQKIETVTVSFGWGCWSCDDESPDVWKNYSVVAAELPTFLGQREKGVGFVPGKGDLRVKSDKPALEVHFCHESDIHVSTSNESICQALLARWKNNQFPGYTKVKDKWVKWDGGA